MTIELPGGFAVRPPTAQDAQAVTDLIVACDIDEFGRPEYGLEDLLALWRRKNLNLETDASLILAPDGTLAGYMDMYDKGDVVQLNNNSCVHPAFKNQGIEDWILQEAEDWARERAPGDQAVIRHVVNAGRADKAERMWRWGYEQVRNAWIMEIDLADPPPSPVVPAGIVLRAFERGRDERAVWACIQEAFRDLWEHKDVPYDEWASLVLEHAAWSPELSYVATDGDEIAGATITLNDELGGWVQQVAVRRPWRGRGIGLALLHQVFGELHKLGVPRAGLEVDAENPSGALRLYQRAGMHVQQHWTEFRKALQVSQRVEE
jgi:GNAT superfamily N-acetyltransferase